MTKREVLTLHLTYAKIPPWPSLSSEGPAAGRGLPRGVEEATTLTPARATCGLARIHRPGWRVRHSYIMINP